VTLLAAAGIITRSFIVLMRTDPGFDAERVVVMSIGLPESRYATTAQRAAFFERLERELESLPEIAAVTVADGLPPFAGFSIDPALQAEGEEPLAHGQSLLLVPWISVAPDFLTVLGGRILAGRDLAAADIGSDNVLIDHRLARALFDDNAVGRRFRMYENRPWLRVVGVFQHMSMIGLDDRMSPYAVVEARDPGRAAGYMSVGIRPSVEPRASLLPIRRVVQRLDPDLPISELAPARAALTETIDKPRFMTGVMVAIALTALALTGIGIYGILSYAVARRRREMGIRMALGSPPARVRAMIVRSGLLVTIAGIVVGLAGAIALGRLMSSLLFGIEPDDPLTLGAVVTLVLLVATVASFIPARRATHVDPVDVLRSE
jgi:putative ABC transport system permease protein